MVLLVYMMQAASCALGGEGSAGLSIPISSKSAKEYTLTPCSDSSKVCARRGNIMSHVRVSWTASSQSGMVQELAPDTACIV